MRTKLKLQMEDLSVESFDTDAPKQRRGRVFGCQVNTCGYTCYGTCDANCTQGYDATCRNIGTCNWNDPWYACADIP